MTDLQKFVDEGQAVLDATGNPAVADVMTKIQHGAESKAEHLYVLTAVSRFGQALQHLREIMARRDTLSRRVAELQQRIANMQDDAKNPPKLRTTCTKECDE